MPWEWRCRYRDQTGEVIFIAAACGQVEKQ
jgi:hypothetical protein